MTVVDLSKYQGVISTATFKSWLALGVTRIILKIGGGNDGRYEDSLFATNLANANAAGMPSDGYWFNGTTDPVQDAIFAHSVIPKGMRIWWDVENEGSMPHWGDSSLNAAARQGVSLGHPAGAYMSSSVTFGNWASSTWMPLWVAGYGFSSLPPIGPGWKAVLWQFTSTGHEPGYGGYIDISEIQQGWADLVSSPIDPLGGLLMPALLEHPTNHSVGFIGDNGLFDVISDVNEMQALEATGIVKAPIATTSYIWDLLVKRSARLRAADNPNVTVNAPAAPPVDVAAISGAVSAAVIAALPAGTSTADLQAAVTAAIKSVHISIQ